MHRQIERERKRERSREREREREGERERCFVIFLNSENSSTYFKVSCISLQKILIDEMSSLSDFITNKRH